MANFCAMSDRYSEIETLLGEPLEKLISNRRAAGVSWRRIALEITNRTDVDVAGETLRIWHLGVTPVANRAGGAA